MLIPIQQILNAIKERGLSFEGVLHIGAHECEELDFYRTYLNVPAESIVWMDALAEKVEMATARGIPNVYHATVTDKDDEEVTFHVSCFKQFPVIKRT